MSFKLALKTYLNICILCLFIKLVKITFKTVTKLNVVHRDLQMCDHGLVWSSVQMITKTLWKNLIVTSRASDPKSPWSVYHFAGSLKLWNSFFSPILFFLILYFYPNQKSVLLAVCSWAMKEASRNFRYNFGKVSFSWRDAL